MVTGTSRVINSDGAIGGSSYLASLSVSPNCVPLPNENFVEEIYCKGSIFVVTVSVVITFWDWGEHKPLIIALFLPIISISKWRGT